MSSVTKVKLEHPRDLLNLALAVVLIVLPWVLGFTGETLATRTALGTGLAIAVVSILALFARSARWVDAVGLLLGVWAVVSPWILGFTAIVFAQWALVAVGVLLVAVAAWEVWTGVPPKPVTT